MSNWLCDDWQCPAKESCRNSFFRSKAYAAMDTKHPPLRKAPRDAGAECCDLYERDKVRAWLVPLTPPMAVGAWGRP